MAANANAQNGELRQEQRETVGTDDITPDAVEKKLIDETHDTGAAAYQFNPDASPEEKASAARGVCPLIIRVVFLLTHCPLGCAPGLPSSA
jgi:hypothetical protein